MDREDVYKLINNERDYQDAKWKTRDTLDVAAELLIMKAYFNKAMRSYVEPFGEKIAVDRIRKVVAIGVRCLENHASNGMIRR